MCITLIDLSPSKILVIIACIYNITIGHTYDLWTLSTYTIIYYDSIAIDKISLCTSKIMPKKALTSLAS